MTGSGFSYDANGNMTGDGSNTLTYDAANRLIASSNGTTSGGYVYDGNGIRVEKCVPNCTTGMSDEQATGIGETGQTCSLDGIEVDCGEFDTGGNGVGGDGFVQCQTATCGGFGQGRNGSSYIFYEDYVEGEGYADHTAFEYVGLTDAQVEALGLCDSCQWSGLGFSFSPQGSGGAGANNGPTNSATPPPCQAKILNATNNQFGTNYTDNNVNSTFNYSTGAPAGQGTLNLNIYGSTAGVSPGYYPVHWWTYAIGYGPTLHAVRVPEGMEDWIARKPCSSGLIKLRSTSIQAFRTTQSAPFSIGC